MMVQGKSESNVAGRDGVIDGGNPSGNAEGDFYWNGIELIGLEIEL